MRKDTIGKHEAGRLWKAMWSGEKKGMAACTKCQAKKYLSELVRNSNLLHRLAITTPLEEILEFLTPEGLTKIDKKGNSILQILVDNGMLKNTSHSQLEKLGVYLTPEIIRSAAEKAQLRNIPKSYLTAENLSASDEAGWSAIHIAAFKSRKDVESIPRELLTEQLLTQVSKVGDKKTSVLKIAMDMGNLNAFLGVNITQYPSFLSQRWIDTNEEMIAQNRAEQAALRALNQAQEQQEIDIF